MRRYSIEIGGTNHEVDVEEVTANTFRVSIAGQQVDVRLRDHQELSQAMIAPGLEVATVAPGAQTKPLAPTPSPSSSTASQSARPAPAATPVPAGTANALTAPMPGVVLSISAQVGQAVKRGDVLLVLEAMKMKNELRAARDGVVTAIQVEVGQQVTFGQQLVVFQ